MIIYLPALVNIFVFGLYTPVAVNEYHLVKTTAGWINKSPGGPLDIYFNLFYLTYSLACLAVLQAWGFKTQEAGKKRAAFLTGGSFIVALVLGTLTDRILNTYIGGQVHQLGIVFTIIPISVILYLVVKYGELLSRKPGEPSRPGNIFRGFDRIQLFHYISWAFVAGSLLNFGHYLYYPVEFSKVIIFSSALLTTAVLFRLIPMMPLEEEKQNLLLYLLLALSIPLINNQFIEQHGSNIIWPIPLIFMLLAAVFRQRLFLAIIVVVSVYTQIRAWQRVPELTVMVSDADYLIRIAIFLLAALLAYYVNRVYMNRLIKNEAQTNLQRIIAEISASLVRVSPKNLDEKLNHLLEQAGRHFEADRSYIFINTEEQSTPSYAYEWCKEGVKPALEQGSILPTANFPWWRKQLSQNNAVYIPDVTKLTPEAAAEKTFPDNQQIKSLLAVPIMNKKQLLGFLGFESVRILKKWEESHRETLQVMANVVSDALLKVAAENEINYMAYYDQLTGLPNRTMFKNRLEKAIPLAQRSEKLIGLIFIDLDSFQAVNDTLGHKSGDKVLKHVAEQLCLRLRKYDTICRFGGDEFLVMLPQMVDLNDIQSVVEKLMAVFEEPILADNQEFFITASSGVSVYPTDGTDAETLVKNADLTMHASKDRGKNQVTYCTSDMKKGVTEKVQLTNQLYRALERDELILHYQPQISISNHKIVGLEALIRWQHPEKGLVFPDAFIQLAEQTGLINPIGQWVLETACRQNKAWQDIGLSPVKVAVNLSVEQFREPNLVSVVTNALAATKLSPAYLELEITETTAIEEPNYIIKRLNDLKELMVSISIDDFGTGYSSLSRLKELPIDRIKMAMQFVHGIAGSHRDEAIAMVIINLATSLGLKVIAEGVETEKQLIFLANNACDEAQGYYFYKPLPAAAVEALLLRYENCKNNDYI